MNASEFLEKVLAEGNFYCLLALRNGGKQWEDRKQLFFTTHDELLDAAIDFDADGWDTFYALGSFAGKGSRSADLVENVQAFFLDLDIGDDVKKYATRPEAMAALKTFCKEVSLPKPIIVDSGYGLHVYWPLSEPVPVRKWQVVAAKFKGLVSSMGLRADSAVTSDAARVLRIPSMHNWKGDSKVQVNVLCGSDPVSVEDFAKVIGMASIVVPAEDDGTISLFTEAMRRNNENSFKDIMVKTKAGRGCEQLKIIATDQDSTSEPMWRAGLSIAKFCNDGEIAAHKISKGHEGYSPDLTQAKFDLIKGPYTCTTFDENNAGVCPDCPNWGKIKSPVTLGKKFKEATEEEVVYAPATELPNAPVLEYVIPTYPKPYFRGANGGVYMRLKNADGDVDEKTIYHNDLYVVRRLKDVELGEAIVMRLHLPMDGVSEFTVPLTSVTSREEFRKQMSMRGVAVTKVEELMQYTTTWINELQNASAADEAHRQFGWPNKKMDKFILGNQEIHADKVKFNPPSSQTAGLFPAFEPKGDLQGWIDTVNFYNRDGMELHQYILGTGFGSVLMPFSSLHCAAMHIHSKESGLGKTTAMIAGASIWGNPEELIIQERDTYATKMNRGEMYHNLPLYMDELTNSHGTELSDLAYQLTSGRQRGRMTSGANQERHRGEAWQLLAVTTGNTSLIERISMIKNMPKAEAQRVLECHVKKVHFSTKEETDVFSKALTENYGWAGVPFVQYVMNNVEEVKQICADMQARVDRLAGLTAENRFWSVHAAMTLAGLHISNNLKLTSFDLPSVEKWIINQLRVNKATVDDMSVSIEQMLNDYMSEHFNSMIWIKSTARSGGEQNNGLDSLVIPDMMPRANKLVGRYETDLKRAYLLPKPLKEWCGKQQINYTQLVQDLKDKLGAKKKKVRITKGTQMQLPPADCIIVDCDASVPEEVMLSELHPANVRS
jgi:hypothetical protein